MTGTQSDFLDYKAKRNIMNFKMRTARTEFYQNFIELNSSDQRKLFAASKKLLNLKHEPVFTDHSLPDCQRLANDIGTYFIQKIERIRSKLESATTPGVVVFATFNSIDPEVVMDQFQSPTET